MPNPVEVAVDTEEEMIKWIEAIEQCTTRMAGEVIPYWLF